MLDRSAARADGFYVSPRSSAIPIDRSGDARALWRRGVVAAAAYAIVVLLTALGALVPSAEASSRVTVGANLEGITSDTVSSLDTFSSGTGFTPAIAMSFRDWTDTWSTALITGRFLEPIYERGSIPMITWTPTVAGADRRRIASYSPAHIAAGDFDAYIQRAARETARLEKPIFIRLAHEMNGDWYPWGDTGNPEAAANYISMWKHVVTLFRRAGATNVRWVWSPNVFGHNGVASPRSAYPGDDWVDWVGLDGYNWGSTRPSGWQSPSTLFLTSYRTLAQTTTKPMMIAETASAEVGGDKAAWIREFATILPAVMPKVRTVIWFDRNKETDWRWDSSPQAAAAFRAAFGPSRHASTSAETIDVPEGPAVVPALSTQSGPVSNAVVPTRTGSVQRPVVLLQTRQPRS